MAPPARVRDGQTLSQLPLAVLTAVVVAVFLVAPQAAMAAPGDACTQSEAAQPQDIAATPWAQTILDPERAWPFSRGGDITVAVIDSGVDAGHPQLAGKVLDGQDMLAARGGKANNDCVGTGTEVAGVIVAQSRKGVGLRGVAPGARILPVRVIADPEKPDAPVPGPVLVNAISYAVSQGAKVVDISVATAADDPAVRAAIDQAQQQNVLVVAPVGDVDDNHAPLSTEFPAKYQGVLEVGAIGQTGAVWPNSRTSSSLDLVAPGEQVMTTQLGNSVGFHSGTRLAAAYVAGAAALVWARYRSMSASQVAHQLTATAVPAPGGTQRRSYGQGLVNPYGAVTDTVVAGAPKRLPGMVPAPRDPVQAAHEAAWANGFRLAWWLTGAAALLALLTLVVAVAVPRGRRRRWRAAIAAPPPQPPDEEPAPPVLLFEDQHQ